MSSIPFKQAVDDFLAQKTIAVVGVSRNSGEAANFVYRKLREKGYRMFAVNPRAETVEGDTCYPGLETLPELPDGALVFTPPDKSEQVVRECAGLGIRRVWLHRSFGAGSYSEPACIAGREQGVTVIPGGCPAMYSEPVDAAHKCIRFLCRFSGAIPRTVDCQ